MLAEDLTASTLSYREAYEEWLSRVFSGVSTDLVTLTFAPRSWERDVIGPTGPTQSRVMRAAARFERVLMRSLAKPSWFIVREYGGMNGRAHLHCLVSSVDPVVIREATEGHLGDGFGKISHVKMSAVEYVVKYVSKSDRSWWSGGGPLYGQHAR